MEFKEFELRDYTFATHESDFIKDVLELLIHNPKLRRFSMNLQKAWRALVLLDELEIITNILVQENSCYSTESRSVLLDFIQLTICRADCALNALEREPRHKHDLYTPRKKIFNELKKDLTLIKDRTNGLNNHLIELIMALWVLGQKRGRDKFNDFWTSDLKEYWSALRNECPTLFYKPEVIISSSKDKETTMKKRKKRKVAI